MLKSDFQKDLAITFDSLTWLVHTSVLGYTCSHLRDILEDDTKTKPTKVSILSTLFIHLQLDADISQILPLEMDLPTFSLNKRIRPTRSTRALFAIDKVVEYWYLRCINLSRPISVQYHLPEPSSSHKPVKVCPQDHAPTILRDMASVAEIFGDYELVARTLDTFQAYFSTTENLQPFYLRSVIPHFFRSSPEETTDLDICFRKLLVVSICSCTPSETDAHNLSSDERFRSLVRRITDEAQAM